MLDMVRHPTEGMHMPWDKRIGNKKEIEKHCGGQNGEREARLYSTMRDIHATIMIGLDLDKVEELRMKNGGTDDKSAKMGVPYGINLYFKNETPFPAADPYFSMPAPKVKTPNTKYSATPNEYIPQLSSILFSIGIVVIYILS